MSVTGLWRRHRLGASVIVAVSVVAIAWSISSLGQSDPKPAAPNPREPSFAAEQYVTQLDLAQRELAAIKSSWVWRIGLIISLVGAGASFGSNSRAIKEFRGSLERHEKRLEKHSGIHERHEDEIRSLQSLESKVDTVVAAVARIEKLESMRSVEGQREYLGELLGELIREQKNTTA